MSSEDERIIKCDGDIEELRERYKDGLHFVVGDVHGQLQTLKDLLAKVGYDAEKDHVFFLGDYVGGDNGGDVPQLISFLSSHYEADYEKPGFHLIRGNHERELADDYPLPNLPDIIVVRAKNLNFFLVHAGMVTIAFDVINRNMEASPEQKVFAYRIEGSYKEGDPLRQIIWSKDGLYSHSSKEHVWPSEESLNKNRACIVHGHSPYCCFQTPHGFTYGSNNVFWENQHVLFCEDLQSFNLDSNIKGRTCNGRSYRGLACLCLEVCEEVASMNESGKLTIEGFRTRKNGVFGASFVRTPRKKVIGDCSKLLSATPMMKSLYVLDGVPHIRSIPTPRATPPPPSPSSSCSEKGEKKKTLQS